MNPEFCKKQQESKMATSGQIEEKQFSTNSPIIKCDISFLTNFATWNLFLDLKLQF